MKTVRTRFAPSPTGSLHIGGLRTALYNFLFARHNQGEFILRIEDTDQQRLVPGTTEKIIQTIKEFKLFYDEGPDKIGKFGPYVQSQRLLIYRKMVEQLVSQNKAYLCFCSPERLTKLREIQLATKSPTKYDGWCKNLSADEIKNKITQAIPYVVRLKIEPGETYFQDLIRGEIIMKNENIDEPVLIKSDGFPTYHLANVVDDYLMKISHVIRGEEWVPSTPKHILLYQAFGWEPPQFAHLPLLLNNDKSKLSKRQGDVAAEDYLAKGYLPEAIINFIALLGWNPGNNEEFFTLDKLIEEFSLTKIQKAGAVFNQAKLDWYNAHYLKQTNDDLLIEKIKPFLIKQNFFTENKFTLKKIIALFKDRQSNLSDMAEQTFFLFNLPDYEKSLLITKNFDLANTKKVLHFLLDFFETYKRPWLSEQLKKDLDQARQEANFERGQAFWPLRVAVTGLKDSPDAFLVMEVLGKNDTLKRIKTAIAKLS